MKDFPCARQSIGGQEEHTPLLVLPDMHMLVRAQQGKRFVACAQNDMAKCYGTEAEWTGQCRKEPTRPTTVELDNSRHHAHPPAKAQHGKSVQDAEH